MLTGLYGLPTGHNVALKLGGGLLVFDSFDRANSTTTMGAEYTAHTGTWGINSNRAYTAVGAAAGLVSRDVGAADVDLEVPLDVLGSWGGIVVRLSDANNYIMLFCSSGTDLFFRKNVAGSISTYHSGAASLAAGSVLRLSASGNALAAYHNGALFHSATDAFNNTATRVGLYTFASDTTVRFGSLTVRAA